MKRFLLLPITAILAFSSNAQLITDNLLLHYPIVGNANDASGNGFDGTVSATLTADRFGTANEAFAFNGVDNYIDLPNDPMLKPQLPVSLAFWVKFDDNSITNSNVIVTDNAYTSYCGVWVNRIASGAIAISYGDDSGNTTSTNRRSKIGSTSLQANTWYHVAFTVNSALDMEIYINCKNDGGTYSGTGGPSIAYSNAQGSIGKNNATFNGSTSYFKGSIDDLYYWDRALVPSDLTALCSSASVENFEEEPTEIVESLILYPNPSENTISLKGNDSDKVISYTIINAEGRVLVSESFDKSSIYIGHLANGVYYLKLETESASIVKEFRKLE